MDKQTRVRLPGGAETYEGDPCKTCNGTIRQSRDNRCLTCLKARQSKYNIELREKNFMQTHGVSYAQRDKMFYDQKGKCAICGHEGHVDFVPKGARMFDRLVVDHCHSTGKVRGLLCNGCNRGIGYLKDSTEVMKSAIKYLEDNE